RGAGRGDADIAFVMAARVPKDLLAEARRLRFIQKLGAGVDRIDLDACRKQGIGLARLHAGNSVPVAEHTILLMLATYRQLPQIDRRTRAGAWNKEDARGEHRHLHGKIVGLVGFGAIGKEVAKRLRGFEVKILYYDPVRASRDVEQSLAADYADLDTLVRCQGRIVWRGLARNRCCACVERLVPNATHVTGLAMRSRRPKAPGRLEVRRPQ